MGIDSGIPEGYKEVKGLTVYTNGKVIVCAGDPPDEEKDPEAEIHDCDAMGCNWEHVIFRAKPINSEDKKGLSFLFDKEPTA